MNFIRAYHAELVEARRRLIDLQPTPLLLSPRLTAAYGRKVLLKLESEQLSGSFKYRGALNKAMAARERGRRELCTASTGNHGLAIAMTASALGLACTVLVPASVPRRRFEALERSGAVVEVVRGDVHWAEQVARGRSDPENGIEFVSPYNDIEIIAGHSTLADEVVHCLGPGDGPEIVCSTGGGGLVSGLCLGLLFAGSAGRVHSVAPAASPVLARGIARGWLEEELILPTVSDATAGNIDHDTITFEIAASLVASFTEVTEVEIVESLEGLREGDGLSVEGAAGVAVAGALKAAKSMASTSTVVIVICGAN